MLDSLKSSVNYCVWDFIRNNFSMLRKHKQDGSFELMEIDYYSIRSYLEALHSVDAIPNVDCYFLLELLYQVRFGRSIRVNSRISLYKSYKKKFMK